MNEEMETLPTAGVKDNTPASSLALVNTDDIQNARNMMMSGPIQGDTFTRRFPYFLAAFWSVFAAGYIFGITFGAVPTQSVRFADNILGFITGTVISTILYFFFGSSNSAGKKDDTIGKIAASK